MCRTPDDVKFFGRAKLGDPTTGMTDSEQAAYWKASRDRMAAQNMEMGAKLERKDAAIEALTKSLEAMLGAVDNNGIDSQEIDGDYEAGIPPHKWHEEWAHHARAALSLSRSGT